MVLGPQPLSLKALYPWGAQMLLLASEAVTYLEP